ncbi:18S rRNA biogenesis protein RCL1 [Cryptococcus amylolentus CBS 6039]|uniref:18S rRNA biogenesis protein RCL1 n=2 Tax=Cryptococcus amylolentus TaxID=104669 RepID=A0A1E3HA01_9TREE|nr:18S rRNA biogenesis protein RCL1 [Cryptococcus amylolentus CBS 6039]ODN72975.1 18S rRNA biogenesis protein RCL1 [Cryptococcus amylolentus CBS 6039]ODN98138.1 18S rRNA biogenesis protein RCL1 [Cryptococcus amylolentus CBS 6273]
MQAGPSKDILRFTGHRHLRQRILLAVLSGKSIRIDAIRSDDVHVGLRDYEVNLLRLVEKVTNGSTVEISLTGTSFLFHPGLLPGGSFTHTCHIGRSIGYYLEVLVPLAPFCKKPFNINLYGVTGEEGKDMTVDMIRTVTLPHLHLFGVTDGLELQIKKRGAAPLGGGQVIFKCPIVRQLNTLQFLDKGKIKKIRGVSYSTRVSPQFANRMVESARSILNRYIPDVYLYTDVYKGEDSGKSPGYGLTLVTQSTTSVVHSAECLSLPSTVTTPEDIALHASRLLLEEISQGGCVDSKHQWMVALLMALGKEDVSKCLFGRLTPYTIQFFRDMFVFFGTKYKLNEAESTGEVMVSCIGTGYSNVNKTMA